MWVSRKEWKKLQAEVRDLRDAATIVVGYDFDTSSPARVSVSRILQSVMHRVGLRLEQPERAPAYRVVKVEEPDANPR